MPITVACTCGKSYPVKDEFAGLQVQCPDCGTVLTIPIPPGFTLTPPAAPPTKHPTPPPPTRPVRSRPPRIRRRSLRTPLLILGVLLLAIGGGAAGLIVLVPKLLQASKDEEGKSERTANGATAKPPTSSGPWKGHTAPIRALGFSVDGRFVLSAAGGYEERNGTKTPLVDNSLRFWEADSGKEHRLLSGFREAITAAAFSADAHFAVLGCAGASFEVCLYDVQAEQEIRRFPGHTAEIHCVALSADGRRIVSGSADNSVRVWDVENGKPLHCLQGHEKAVYSVSLSTKGNLALSGGGDQTVRLWDIVDGLEVQKFTDHQDPVWAVALSPDGKRAASAGGSGEGAKDYTIRIWDAIGGDKVGELRGHTEKVGALAFSPDGQRLLSGGADGVRVWQVGSGKKLTHFGSPGAFVRAVAFAPDARRAVSGSEDGTLQRWELPPGVPDWIRDLSGNEMRRRLTAAQTLGGLGAEARPAIPELLRALTDSNDDLRKEALSALNRVGPPDGKEVALLLPVLRNARFAEGQRYALGVLQKLGSAAEPAVAGLVDALTDADDAVRLKAIELLGTIGPPARSRAWSPLAALLQDADPALRTAAAAALAKLGPPGRDAIGKLLSLLNDRRDDSRRFALTALAGMGIEAVDTVPALRDAATKEEDAELRVLALTALQKIQPYDKDVRETFIRALEDKSAAVCEQAARALAAIGPRNGALPSLLQALEHRNANVVRIVGEALQTAPLEKANVPLFVQALQSKNATVRLHAIEALGRLGGDAAASVNALCDLLKGASVEQRRALVVALGKIGSAARAAGPRLVELLKDDDLLVSRETAMTLAQIEAAEVEQAIPVLVKTLRITKANDPPQLAARQRAHDFLIALGKPAARGLAAALRGEFTGGRLTSEVGKANVEARLAVLQTLADMGDKANVPEVLLALGQVQRTDPIPALRQAAKVVRAKVLKKP